MSSENEKLARKKKLELRKVKRTPQGQEEVNVRDRERKGKRPQEESLPEKENPSMDEKLALRKAKRTPQGQEELNARRREQEGKRAQKETLSEMGPLLEKETLSEKKTLLEKENLSGDGKLALPRGKRPRQPQEEVDARQRERAEKRVQKETLPKEDKLTRGQKMTLRRAKRTPQRQQELDARKLERAKTRRQRKERKYSLQNKRAAEAKLGRRKERQERRVAKFGVLPEELLLEIFSYVHELEARLSTLASVALVSRTVRRLVTPLLYSKFSDSEARSAFYREPKNKPNRTCLFLRTILDFPYLAKYVKVAELEFSSEYRSESERDLDAEHLLRTACSRLLPLNQSFWAKQATNQSMDSITAVVLYFLPKLESLSLCLSDEEFSVHPILDAVVSDRNGKVVLANLKKLRIEACDNFELNYMDITPWLRLPSLISFTGKYLTVGSDVSAFGSSNLTSVTISEGAIRKSSLGALLGSVGKLKSFSYVFNTNGAILDPDWATPFEVIDALRNNPRNCLKSLEICCPPYGEEKPASWNPSMVAFKKLTCLKIDGCLLPQPTCVLPKTIKELHLHDCDPYFTEDAEKLTKAIKSANPALKSSGITTVPCPSESTRR